MTISLPEKNEDEYDIHAAEAAYVEYLKNPVTYSHAEAMQLLETQE